MSVAAQPLSPPERFARIRETVAQLRQVGCNGLLRAHLTKRLIDDLAHLEEIGALEAVADLLGVTYGGRI